MNEEDQFKEIEQFETTTNKEITIWDWLGRILPLSVLAIISICYMFDLKEWLDIVIEISAIVFFIICISWWYWALHKIGRTIQYVRNSQKKFMIILDEFRKLKKNIRPDAEK